MLVSHHPYVIPGVRQVVLHTALDCCAGGLNDQWRDALGVKNAKHFDGNLGWYGNVDPIHPDDLYQKVANFIGTAPIGACFTDKEVIESVCICTGLGGMVHARAQRISNADCYIFGQDVADPNNSPFPSIIEVGHTLSEYATGLKVVREVLEPMGVKVDGADLKYDKFGTEVYIPWMDGEPDFE
jgi:putative NIF3 family GTP cyclohydrolase 1 type 2